MKHIALDKRRYQVNSFSYFPMKNMWVLIKINLDTLDTLKMKVQNQSVVKTICVGKLKFLWF